MLMHKNIQCTEKEKKYKIGNNKLFGNVLDKCKEVLQNLSFAFV